MITFLGIDGTVDWVANKKMKSRDRDSSNAFFLKFQIISYINLEHFGTFLRFITKGFDAEIFDKSAFSAHFIQNF